MSDDLTGTQYTSRNGTRTPSCNHEADLARALSELKARQSYLVGVVSGLESGHVTLPGVTLRNVHVDLQHIQKRSAALLLRVEHLLEKRI